jgi:Icc-related predicted phosphoesterase
MRIALISDVHLQTDGLDRVGDGVDLFICLGDLILFLDYEDPGVGIFADLFGAQNTRRYIRMRTRREFDDARSFGRELWESIGGDPWQVISERVGEQYAELFKAMPAGLFTYGNVDLPSLWPEYLRSDQKVVDGAAVTVDGVRIGFVGGGLQTPMRTPFEIPDAEFQGKVEDLGPVDVLCSHIPPAVPESCYDVVARRMERGSAALLEYIEEYQPRFALHGHVHQPLARRVTIGRTQVINVGHYRSAKRPYVVSL